MSYQRWFSLLKEPIPLTLVPMLLRTDRATIAAAVQRGELHVHSFRAADGRLFQMVSAEDVKALGKNPLLQPNLSKSFDRDAMIRAFHAMLGVKGKPRRVARLPYRSRAAA